MKSFTSTLDKFFLYGAIVFAATPAVALILIIAVMLI